MKFLINIGTTGKNITNVLVEADSFESIDRKKIYNLVNKLRPGCSLIGWAPSVMPKQETMMIGLLMVGDQFRVRQNDTLYTITSIDEKECKVHFRSNVTGESWMPAGFVVCPESVYHNELNGYKLSGHVSKEIADIVFQKREGLYGELYFIRGHIAGWYIKRARELGVLDTWFEPVYETKWIRHGDTEWLVTNQAPELGDYVVNIVDMKFEEKPVSEISEGVLGIKTGGLFNWRPIFQSDRKVIQVKHVL